MTSNGTDRRVFVVAHTGRPEVISAARTLCEAVLGRGIGVRLLKDEAGPLGLDDPHVELVDPTPEATTGCELLVVMGGDGTILRAAELARDYGTPLLGVNLGHVGFLAEVEADDLALVVDAVDARTYEIEDRLTVDVSILQAGQVVASTWALNEASVEKAARERMLEMVLEIDGRPVSRWGADGVVCATPTGSTAYNFSAGGPIVWPQVDALLVVPISAHALFARPMVISPTSVVAVEVLAESGVPGVLWCDGRRMFDLPPGARIEVRRGKFPVRLARVRDDSFTDRLVRKFDLPVQGWRGAAAVRRAGGDG